MVGVVSYGYQTGVLCCVGLVNLEVHSGCLI